ncbi:MAG: hypothetical protein SCABRO_01568 [Candidatus Scalindua brodae]|uniref:Uncharacterized protein n=1 Tax=Candidatus Scalindua brodae TaxID=237368 RepID=A0A0B0ENK9_9BACT|nr:MAG: hypothetical protein SCABRO_01568 [Candidatus Scalindua brodae]
MKSFIELCLEGLADLTEIDEFIEEWHSSKEDIPIYEYLGMKRNEYAIWVERPEALRFILFSRQYGVSIKDTIDQMTELPLAARAADTKELDAVIKWLKRTGRI